MIKRILVLTFLLLTLCAGAHATTISLSSHTVPNWAYGNTAKLRIYVNATFVDSSGVVHMAQATGGPNFYQVITCTVASGVITIPSFTIASTTDSPTNPNATYTFIWYQNNIRRDTFAPAIKVPTVLGTSITWSSLLVFNSTHPNPPGPQYPDVQQVMALINGIAGVVSASRMINTTSPLAGGGSLAADRTLTCPTCVTSSGLTNNVIPKSSGSGLVNSQISDAAGVLTFGTATNGLVYSPGEALAQYDGGVNTFVLGDNGAITIGTWNGTVIAPAFGGTGVNNSTRTLAINTNGGTLAFPVAATTHTFPSSSSTLARTDNSNTFGGTQGFSETVVMNDGLTVTNTITAGGITLGGLTITPAIGTWAWTLPPDDGATGNVLKTNGSGVSSWAAVTSSELSDAANIPLLNAANVFSSTTGQSVKKLLLPGSTSGTVTIQPAAVAGTYTLTLPTDDGTANQLLRTDGAGVLSWATGSGGVAVVKDVTGSGAQATPIPTTTLCTSGECPAGVYLVTGYAIMTLGTASFSCQVAPRLIWPDAQATRTVTYGSFYIDTTSQPNYSAFSQTVLTTGGISYSTTNVSGCGGDLALYDYHLVVTKVR